MTTAGVWFAMLIVYGLIERPDSNSIGDGVARRGHQRKGGAKMHVARWQVGTMLPEEVAYVQTSSPVTDG